MFKRILTRVLDAPKVVAFCIFLIFLIAAVVYPSLKVDLFPPLNFPILNVMTEVPSFSSLEIERQITLPIESVAGGVLGVTRVRSTSATGISMVSVEFAWGTDMLISRQLLIEALSSIRGQLPPGIDPSIENLSTSLSMIQGYSLKGGTDLSKIRDMAVYDLKPRLQRLPGVYKVVVMGGKILEFSVRPNTFLLIKYDVTLDDLTNALVANNILSSPGVVNQNAQELVIHANGQFADEGEIGDVVIAVKGGVPVRIKDVAHVTRAFQSERGDTSENGEPAVLINIYKQLNFDTGTVASNIKTEITKYRNNLPKDFTVSNYYDQAQLVGDSIGSVRESVWVGGLLVIVVLAFFLRSFRATLIATLSIPISVVTAIVLMRFFDVAINIMSLGGLAIGTGIIVDDTIVVLENIFRWFSSPTLSQGLTKSQIVIHATAEVLRPVVISTLTNIGIFLPMIFVSGFAGRLFSPVSFTVTFALLASLVVALLVIPLLAVKWLSDHQEHETTQTPLYRFYARTLDQSLAHPWLVLGGTLAALLAVTTIYARLDVAFLPALDEGAILLQTSMPPGTSLNESRRLNIKIEKWVEGLPGIETVVRRTGHAPGSEDTDNVNHSDITVKLKSKSERPASMDEFIAKLKEKTNTLPSIVVNYLMPLADKMNDALGGVPADIGVDIFGPDLAQLHTITDGLVKEMSSISGIADLRPPSDIPVPSLEIQIQKHEAGRLGISAKAIHDTLQAYSLGLQVTSIHYVQSEIPVVIHYSPLGSDFDLESAQSLPLRTSGGSTVPLEQVAHLKYGEIPNEINHENLSRKLTITANVKGRNAKDVAADIEKAIGHLKMPTGYSWGFSGKYKTEQSALANMAGVMLLAIFVVAIILFYEFRSFLQVALILLTLPLAAVGAVLSLWITRESINVSSMIGAIMLVGIVVRNGIMLLDYMNTQIEEGASVHDAIHIAAMKRVRPILMTASVTILGLVPLAAGWGTGSELQRPLAIAVIGGILTSTLLTLIVLPSAVQLVLGKRLSASSKNTHMGD